VSRIARVIIPGCPHHLIQRGNRRQKVFFCDEDKAFYLTLLGRLAHQCGISIWAYCLMDNHVHLVAAPQAVDSFSRGLGEAHRRYTVVVNTREGWRGYLWQGRYLSYPLDETYCYAAVRYVERNPVRAGLVKLAEAYEWSSARAHVRREGHPLLAPFPLQRAIPDWSAYLGQEESADEIEEFRRHERTGRPLGSEDSIKRMETLTGRILAPKNMGRPLKGGTKYHVPTFNRAKK